MTAMDGLSGMDRDRGMLLVRLVGDQSGATAVEYAVIAGSIALAIVVGIEAVGGGLNALLNSVASTAF